MQYDKIWKDDYARGFRAGVFAAIDAAEELAADAVQVVRCKECRHSAEQTEDSFLCNRKMLGLVRTDDFCSFGEKREVQDG